MFDPISASIMGAGIGIQALGASSANKKASREAKRNRAFTQWSREYEHRTKVHSLKKAGLNPMLAVSGGMSSSLAHSPTSPNFQNTAQGAAQAAKESALLTSQIKNVKADTNLKNQQAVAAGEQASMLVESARREQAVANKQIYENVRNAIDAEIYDTAVGEASRWLDKLFPNINLPKGKKMKPKPQSQNKIPKSQTPGYKKPAKAPYSSHHNRPDLYPMGNPNK